MSLNVLVIPEDHTHDEAILKPIIKAMLEALGQPGATVQVCRSPRLRGIADALDAATLETIVDRYAFRTDLFLLCVDRDGEAGRCEALVHRERLATDWLRAGRTFFAVAAEQEIEVWLLAGHDLPADWSWRDIRAEPDAKERYYEPFARRCGMLELPAEGRSALALAAARRYSRIRRRCKELALLEQRISQWLSAGLP